CRRHHQAASRCHRQRRQRLHRHPLSRPPHAWLRPPPHRRRRCRPVHGLSKEKPRNLDRGDRLRRDRLKRRQAEGWLVGAGGCLHQVEAFKHSTVPSIIFEMPFLNPSGLMISLAATASVMASAFCKNDIAASFFSAPGLLPKSPSIPLTSAGTNAIPRSN